MSGTLSGGIKAAQTNREKYGNDFYAKIGAKGGSRTVCKGFGANPQLAQQAGRIGGMKSRRGKTLSDKERKLRRQYYYACNRVNYFKKRLLVLETDYKIQEAENRLEEYQKAADEFKKLINDNL